MQRPGEGHAIATAHGDSESASAGQCGHSREDLEEAQALTCCHCSFPCLSQLLWHEDNPFHIPPEKNGPSLNAMG